MKQLKTGQKSERFDKKQQYNMYIFNLKRQMFFFLLFLTANKAINMNFLLLTLNDSFY